jgi:hypothetical protein
MILSEWKIYRAMSEELKPQELENDQPAAPEELTEHELNEIAGGNGSSPVHGAPPVPGGWPICQPVCCGSESASKDEAFPVAPQHRGRSFPLLATALIGEHADKKSRSRNLDLLGRPARAFR